MIRLVGLARAAGTIAMVSLAAPPTFANEALKWNELTVKAVTMGGQNPVQLTRTVAMVQAAVHDALNAIKPRYSAYYFEAPAAPGASAEAAIATASHTVLAGVIPSFGNPQQRSEALAALADGYRASLAAIQDGGDKDRGIALGKAAGEAIVALRAEDGATRPAPYTPASGPGRWRPHPNPDPPNPPIKDAKAAPGFAASILPGSGNVTPFTLLSSSQYWLPGPPALTSDAYVRDFEEVKAVGGQASKVRTPEQAEIARFWFEGPGTWYRVARAAAQERKLDATESARALAAVSLAMADSYIAGFKIGSVRPQCCGTLLTGDSEQQGCHESAGFPGSCRAVG